MPSSPCPSPAPPWAAVRSRVGEVRRRRVLTLEVTDRLPAPIMLAPAFTLAFARELFMVATECAEGLVVAGTAVVFREVL